MPSDLDPVLWVSLGAGGHAASVADALSEVGALAGVAGESTRRWDVRHFETDAEAIAAAQSNDWKVLVAVGDNRLRLNLLDGLPADVLFSATAVTATAALDTELGAGTVVLHHAHVGPGARLGRAVVVNTGAIVEHDCVIGDGAHIAPGAVVLGEARIGACAFIGSGARILPGRTVGQDAVVGAGAVVVDDVPDGVTVVGQPARQTGVGE